MCVVSSPPFPHLMDCASAWYVAFPCCHGDRSGSPEARGDDKLQLNSPHKHTLRQLKRQTHTHKNKGCIHLHPRSGLVRMYST